MPSRCFAGRAERRAKTVRRNSKTSTQQAVVSTVEQGPACQYRVQQTERERSGLGRAEWALSGKLSAALTFQPSASPLRRALREV